MAKLARHNTILLLMVTGYALFFGILTTLRHYHFFTQAWDMGIYVQTLWNTLEGNIMRNSIEEVPHHFGVYFAPLLFAFVPGYALFQSPYFLLVTQSIALALGALPIYAIARHYLQKRALALLMAAGYLLYPSLHWINLFDFHEIAFAVPLTLSAFYFLDRERWIPAVVLLALTAAARIDAAIGVFFIGLFLLIRKYPFTQEKKSISKYRRTRGGHGLIRWELLLRSAPLCTSFSRSM